ncbi:VOC family protein [Sphingobacterium sp. CZ-2]|uniref:VOC family protein n=1 Tax=Sphingobacterium sp. CZ-2 TaxID=2557994 RepID=UPI00106F4505|nr:VOC family protein [Sphingobacterium sp. CZ-2]QBR12986.1 glyoxalase/bleomycin resistance/extradiol dioxygenase family protein [Sphingobacterium sp. CZ-2]
MQINTAYINFAIKDVERTKKFWQALGFSFNEEMTDERAVTVVLKEGQLYAMFIIEDFFKTLTEKPLPMPGTSQVVVALGCNSREEIDEVIRLALENGASQHEEPQDYGWMYQNSFWDINGFGWNLTYVDFSKMPENSEVD